MAFTQAGRFLSVTTPLGEDVLLLESFQGREEMSAPYEFELEMISEQDQVDAGAIIGRSVAFALHPKHGDARVFNGFVRRFAFAGFRQDGIRRYRAVVVPWIWFLGKRSNHRIFQDKNVLDIVEQVFTDAGFDAFETSGITGTYPPYEYCVQMGETDLDFVSRLLEEEGIYYFFRFEADRQVLVLGDSKALYTVCEVPRVSFAVDTAGADHVSQWEHRFEFVSGRWVHTDFDFKAPTTPLLTESDTVLALPSAAAFERYEYPGRFSDKGHGEDKIKARMEAEESRHDVVEGAGGCWAFTLGAKFELEHRLYADDDGKSFVLTAIEHAAEEGSYSRGGGGGAGGRYHNRFRCIPGDVPFRPARRTPKPIVHGPQTAIVVGPSGEEIHTDEFGRIKVQFHWDRQGQFDDKSSCWIRVAQSSAGKRWGAQILPRVGQEVVVEFLDGDPDRPLVTGAVYNANTMPAYELPANKTQSGLRSRSTKGGAADALNEIRFEDKKGEEHIFVHAQKDEHRHVVHDRFDFVGNEEHRTVVKDRLEKVGGDHHSLVEGDRLAKVQGASSGEVGGDRKRKVGGADGLDVGGDLVLKVGGDHGLDIGGAQKLKAGMDVHAKAGMDMHLKAGMNFAADGGMNVHIKGGMNVVIEAGMQLTLKAGAGFVVIGPAGVDISGPMVKINSGGAAGSGGGCSPEAPAAPAAPAAPKAPKEPLDKLAAEDAEAAKAGKSSVAKAEFRWTAIESAPATPQAAALESAAETGRPLCEH
jgi:type VI secretion system secreted protein VgrG